MHNIPDAAGRARALDEMLRVLRPGGALALADIAHVAGYRTHLAALSLGDIEMDEGGWPTRVAALLSGGTFRPQTLVGRRS